MRPASLRLSYALYLSLQIAALCMLSLPQYTVNRAHRRTRGCPRAPAYPAYVPQTALDFPTRHRAPEGARPHRGRPRAPEATGSVGAPHPVSAGDARPRERSVNVRIQPWL